MLGRPDFYPDELDPAMSAIVPLPAESSTVVADGTCTRMEGWIRSDRSSQDDRTRIRQMCNPIVTRAIHCGQ